MAAATVLPHLIATQQTREVFHSRDQGGKKSACQLCLWLCCFLRPVSIYFSTVCWNSFGLDVLKRLKCHLRLIVYLWKDFSKVWKSGLTTEKWIRNSVLPLILTSWVTPVFLSLHLPTHDISLLIRGTQLSQCRLAQLSIPSISCIHSHLVGNPGKWNATGGATVRNRPTFSVYIIVVLMQFRLVNLYRGGFSLWLMVRHKAIRQQQPSAFKWTQHSTMK